MDAESACGRAGPSGGRGFTVSDGLHGDPGCILPVALLVQLNDGLSSVLLRRVQSVQAALMSAQLLHRPRTKGVAGGDQHGETVLDQPVGNLKRDRNVTESQFAP